MQHIKTLRRVLIILTLMSSRRNKKCLLKTWIHGEPCLAEPFQCIPVARFQWGLQMLSPIAPAAEEQSSPDSFMGRSSSAVRQAANADTCLNAHCWAQCSLLRRKNCGIPYGAHHRLTVLFMFLDVPQSIGEVRVTCLNVFVSCVR